MSSRIVDRDLPSGPIGGNLCVRPARALNPAILIWRHRLADGTTVGLRAIAPEDRSALREQLFLKLGMESLRNRFFCVKKDLTELELSSFCRVDFHRHVALVAETIYPGGRRLVGVGRIVRADVQASTAEIAITVQDHFQARGIGSLLLSQLVECARRLGIDRLEAMMYMQNYRVVNLLRGTCLPSEALVENEFLNLALDLRAYWIPLVRGSSAAVTAPMPSGKQRILDEAGGDESGNHASRSHRGEYRPGGRIQRRAVLYLGAPGSRKR